MLWRDFFCEVGLALCVHGFVCVRSIYVCSSVEIFVIKRLGGLNCFLCVPLAASVGNFKPYYTGQTGMLSHAL